MERIDTVAQHYQLLDEQQKVRKGVIRDPIIDLSDALLYKAIVNKASDIHLEPNEQMLHVRYRIDGVLYDQPSVQGDQKHLVLSRLKILSALDIAEQRVPQDGKFRTRIVSGIDGQGSLESVIDLRIATFPTVYGEKMVIRILDRSAEHITLEKLGLAPEVYCKAMELSKKPHGLLLTTGPTGSGKTTTLYALLSELNTRDRNIVTMEDPVEYNLSGITQSQVNSKAGFTFENGLRALLRQDPDVMMIGEIRDVPTVAIAIEAALTGHVVLSTLHTNDAAGAITRLLDMGIEPFLISAALNGVLAQRLVRVLCENCKTARQLSKHEEQRAFAYGWQLDRSYQAHGCQQCFGTGYAGRIGVFELLVMDEEIRDLIMSKTSTQQIRAQAIRDGMKILQWDALGKVKEGVTSLEEFLRVGIE